MRGVPAEEKRQLLLKFASSTVHEVAGPIDQISSLVALFVRRYRGKLDDDADTLLSHIEAARLRLGNAGAGLRKYFQIITAEGGNVPIDMNAALNSAWVSLGKQIAGSAAELSAGSLPTVTGDRDLLTLLFQALLENALKFRRLAVPPRVSVSAQSHVFQVGDNGIGIDGRYLDAVFEPFRKLNGHEYPGAGLGLTLARTIVELHDGRIWIEPGSPGTQVFFELP